MVAFQDGTIHDVATKVGDYNKTGGVPMPQPQDVTEHMMHLVNRCPQEIGEGKGQHLCMGNFRLPSLLAYSNKSPRLIVI